MTLMPTQHGRGTVCHQPSEPHRHSSPCNENSRKTFLHWSSVVDYWADSAHCTISPVIRHRLC